MDFTNCSEKKREKGSVPAGPEQPHGSGPASNVAQPSRRARAPGLNLTGGAQLLVGERGGERGEDDRRGPPVISDLATRGPACSPAAMQVSRRWPERARARRAHALLPTGRRLKTVAAAVGWAAVGLRRNWASR